MLRYISIHIITFFLIFDLSGATVTWKGSANTVWNNSANWLGGVNPIDGDDIVIPSGSSNYPTITNTSHNAFVPRNITIQSGGSITFNHLSGNIFFFTGNWQNDGTFTHTTGIIAPSGSGAQTIGGSSANNFVDLAQAGTGTTTLTANITVSSRFFASMGIFNTSSFTMTGAAEIRGLGGEIRFGSTGGTVPGLTGRYSYSTVTIFDFNANGDQVIRPGKVYSAMIISGTGIKRLQGNDTLTYGIYIAAGATLQAQPDTIVHQGNIWIVDGTFTHSNGTLRFEGSPTITGSATTNFYNVYIVSNLTGASGTMYVSGNWNNQGRFFHNDGTIGFNGTTTINTGNKTTFKHVSITGTLNAPSSDTLGIAGNFVQSGTFNHSDGVIFFDGNTTISGASRSTFNKIIIDDTLTGSSGFFDMKGDWTNNGTYFHNNGRVIFNGVSEILGSSITDFYRVDIGEFITFPGVAKNTLTAPSGIMRVARHWRRYHANNVFVHNNGKVIFNGGSGVNQNIAGNIATTFSRVQLDSPSTITMVRDVVIEDSLILNDGIWDENGSSLSGAGYLDMNNSSELHLAELATVPALNVTVASFESTTSVRMYGGGDQTLAVGRYGDLIIDGNSTTTLENNTTCQNFTIDDATATFDVSASNHTFFVYKNWTNNGTFVPRNGIVNMSGGAAYSIGGTAASTSFYDLNVESGTDVQLNQYITVANGIVMSDGTLDLLEDTIELASAASLKGESSINRVKATDGMGGEGQGNGAIFIILDIGAPTSLNVGELGCILTSDTNMGSTTIYRSHKVQSGSGSFSGNSSIYRTYSIHPTKNTNLNAAFRFSYFDSELNGHLENELEFYKWINLGAGYWYNMGTTSRDGASNYVELTGIESFSPWTLASTSTPLPIELEHFTAVKDNSQVKVNWATLSEINNHYFTVERSLNAIDFNPIGMIESIGEGYNLNEYEFYDSSPLEGESYYRLKQTDFDGTSTYSKVAIISFDHVQEEVFVITNNPNADQNIEILIRSEIKKGDQVLVYDALGRLAFSNSLKISDQYLKIDLSKQFYPGIYIILYSSDSILENKKALLY